VALVEKKTERLATLLSDVVALRGEVVGGRSIYRAWRGRIERPDFAASALNFAHYLAFRRIDLRSLQRRLMVLGLSSLGRSDGHVLATLDAIAWALARMAGQDSRGGPFGFVPFRSSKYAEAMADIFRFLEHHRLRPKSDVTAGAIARPSNIWNAFAEVRATRLLCDLRSWREPTVEFNIEHGFP
jgi:hypothetical protein